MAVEWPKTGQNSLELPPPLRAAFPFRYFNLVQSDTFDAAFGSDAPLVVAAPTGAGKTGVLELALCRLVLRGPATAKALYLAPSRALVSERVSDWRARFGATISRARGPCRRRRTARRIDGHYRTFGFAISA